MRICLISVEIFAWGKYGGFGRATRAIGRELAARGHTVFAVVPRRQGQRPVELLDGITVLGFSPWAPWTAARLLRDCDADIYHSCEPSFGTYLALQVMPDRKHMVTFRDPRDARDWKMEYDLPSLQADLCGIATSHDSVPGRVGHHRPHPYLHRTLPQWFSDDFSTVASTDLPTGAKNRLTGAGNVQSSWPCPLDAGLKSMDCRNRATQCS